MNFLLTLLGLKKTIQRKTLADYQQEMYVKWSRKQFEKLSDLGIAIPVKLA